MAETAAMFVKLPGGETHANRILAERSGGQFDPDVVRAFLDGRDKIMAAARVDAMLGALLDAEPRPHPR